MEEKGKMGQENSETEQIQWHGSFVDSIKLGFVDNAQNLEFKEEKSIAVRDLRIDLVVVEKTPGTKIKNDIGAIFETYNLFEYKNPTDMLTMETFAKVLGYACLYKAQEMEVDETNHYVYRDWSQMTISLVRHTRPAKLLSELEKNGIGVQNYKDGIYYVSPVLGMKIQIIVSSELKDENNVWLKSLHRNISYTELDQLYQSIQQLDVEAYRNTALDLWGFIYRLNKDTVTQWKEYNNMSGGLAELMQPELFEAEVAGIKKGEVIGEKKGEKTESDRVIINLIGLGYHNEDIKILHGKTTDQEIDAVRARLSAGAHSVSSEVPQEQRSSVQEEIEVPKGIRGQQISIKSFLDSYHNQEVSGTGQNQNEELGNKGPKL